MRYQYFAKKARPKPRLHHSTWIQLSPQLAVWKRSQESCPTGQLS